MHTQIAYVYYSFMFARQISWYPVGFYGVERTKKYIDSFPNSKYCKNISKIKYYGHEMAIDIWLKLSPWHVELIKIPLLLLIFSQSGYLFQVDINSQNVTNSAEPDKPTDLDLHCFQRQGISWLRRTSVNI